MRYFIIFFSLLYSFGNYAQEASTEKKVQFGVHLSANFSPTFEFGYSPSFSAKIGQHFVSLGPRFAHSNYKINGSNWKNRIGTDFNYRFYPFKKMKKIKPFSQFTVQHRFEEYSFLGYYDHEGIYAIGNTFSKSFEYESKSSFHFLTFYLGAGSEMTIWKNLSANISGGFGMEFFSSKTNLTDITHNEVIIDNKKNLRSSDLTWILSTGLSYTF